MFQPCSMFNHITGPICIIRELDYHVESLFCIADFCNEISYIIIM